jgi:phage tail-like protein
MLNITPQLFTTFNFQVELTLNGQSQPLCEAGFSECSGLEMSMTPKTIQEGGRNDQQIHLFGPTTYGTLSLKRGMTNSLDLWNWFDQVLQQDNHYQRASGLIVMLAPNPQMEQVLFRLTNCLPVKIRAPGLNAKDGLIAIEEMDIAYERLRIEKP